MARAMCYRCFWPQTLCWCASLQPMATRTRFVFLMHPKEFKEEKAGTGRLTHLCLPNSELHMGRGFDDAEAVQQTLNDPRHLPVLLYPGRDALNLSDALTGAAPGLADAGRTCPALPLHPVRAALRDGLGGRRLVVVLLDATWSGARKMLRLSPSLQRLPRIMFTPSAPSRYVIKQQPQEGCLSTLEAVHELLLVLERAGLDDYPRPDQLLGIFQRMQDFQIRCAADPSRPGYRRKPYGDPAARRRAHGESGERRMKFMRAPPPAPAVAHTG